MEPEAEPEPNTAPLWVSPQDGLVHRGTDPVELRSEHHDLTARIAGNPIGLAGLASIALRDAGQNPNEHQPPEIILELAVDLLERAWPWAEFVVVSVEGARRLRHDVYASARATPPATTDLGPTLAQIRNGEPVGHAVLIRVLVDADTDETSSVFTGGGMRRNKSGDVDRARRKASAGADRAFLIPRR